MSDSSAEKNKNSLACSGALLQATSLYFHSSLPSLLINTQLVRLQLLSEPLNKVATILSNCFMNLLLEQKMQPQKL